MRTKIKNKNITEISSLQNYDGNLLIMESEGLYYISMYTNANYEYNEYYESWDYINKELYYKLLNYHNEIENTILYFKELKPENAKDIKADELNYLSGYIIAEYITSDIINNLSGNTISLLNARFFNLLSPWKVIEKLDKKLLKNINTETFAGLRDDIQKYIKSE